MSLLTAFLEQNLGKKELESLYKILENQEIRDFLESFLERNLNENFDLSENKQKYEEELENIIKFLAEISSIEADLNNQNLNLEIKNEDITASLRATEGYHLPLALSQIHIREPNLLKKFGGHPGAAGFTSSPKNIEKLKSLFVEEILKQKKDLEQSTIFYTNYENIDKLDKNGQKILKGYFSQADVLFFEEKEISLNLLEQIQKLDPFGQDFPFPHLLIRLNSENFQSLNWYWIGKDKDHLKGKVNNINLTIFNLQENKEILSKWIDSKKDNFWDCWVLAKISQNTWQGKTQLELVGNKIHIFEMSKLEISNLIN